MNPPPILLIVLGLILGPGYYLYGEYVSGGAAGTYTLAERADRWTLPDGTIQRFRGGLAYRPVVLDLHPSRNRVRLQLVFELPQTAEGANEYQATLFDVDFPILERVLSVSAGARKTLSFTFEPLEVHSPGEHIFILQELGSAVLAVKAVHLHVREGVEPMVMPLVWLGVGLLLAGVGWLAFSLASRGRSTLKFRVVAPLYCGHITDEARVHSMLDLRHRLLGIAGIALLCLSLPATAQPMLGAQGTASVAAPAALPLAANVDEKGAPPSYQVAALSGDLQLPMRSSEEEALQKLEWELSLKVGKHRRQDDYPEDAVVQRWSGTVLVRVLVDGAGLVKEVTLARTSGFQLLDEQALTMVRRVPRVFLPFQLRGRTQEVSVPIGFYLNSKS